MILVLIARRASAALVASQPAARAEARRCHVATGIQIHPKGAAAASSGRAVASGLILVLGEASIPGEEAASEEPSAAASKRAPGGAVHRCCRLDPSEGCQAGSPSREGPVPSGQADGVGRFSSGREGWLAVVTVGQGIAPSALVEPWEGLAEEETGTPCCPTNAAAQRVPRRVRLPQSRPSSLASRRLVRRCRSQTVRITERAALSKPIFPRSRPPRSAQGKESAPTVSGILWPWPGPVLGPGEGWKGFPPRGSGSSGPYRASDPQKSGPAGACCSGR
jgi:hypothetical protein